MINEKEVVHLILAVSVLAYIAWNGRILRAIPSCGLFFASYSATVLGLVLTVVEGFGAAGLLNILEHAMYAVGTILFAIWIGCVTLRSRRQEIDS